MYSLHVIDEIVRQIYVHIKFVVGFRGHSLSSRLLAIIHHPSSIIHHPSSIIHHRSGLLEQISASVGRFYLVLILPVPYLQRL